MLALLLLACGTPDSDPAQGGTRGDSAAEGGGDTSDTGAGATEFDSFSLAADVSEAELTATIEDLAAFGTRYTFSDGDEAAADYLVGRFEALGVEVWRDGFEVEGEPVENVVGIVPGTVDPDVVFVFSAHYDSTSNHPETEAPGADDNATGVAVVLEAARLLVAHPLAHTAWFVLTAAEEQGSLGSAHLVDEMAETGVDAQGVIAPDMIGYWPLGEGDAMDILGDPESAALVADMETVANELGVANKTWIEHRYCLGDDHTNFQDAGYPAISPMDCVEAHNVRGSDEETPHYHRTTDTPDTLHMGFTTRVAQVTTVTFARWVEPLE